MTEPPFGTPMTYLHEGRQYLVVATVVPAHRATGGFRAARQEMRSEPMRLLTSFAMLALCACSGGSQAPAQPAAATPPQPARDSRATSPSIPRFIGRVWRSTKLGSPLGSILVFLPDRTLLMDSCFETYRVSKWGVAGDHIRWLEDTVPIELKWSRRARTSSSCAWWRESRRALRRDDRSVHVSGMPK
jgi:hypothetical protein